MGLRILCIVCNHVYVGNKMGYILYVIADFDDKHSSYILRYDPFFPDFVFELNSLIFF